MVHFDITGQRFGRLLVLKLHDHPKAGQYRYICQCDCGSPPKILTGANIKYAARSCGCGLTESRGGNLRTHGMTGTPEHRAWRAMIQRCLYPREQNYRYYGGRGIAVCPEWQHDFLAFYRHIGPKPGPGYSVDRINNEGNYEPGNVRWLTMKQQCQNRRPRGSQALAS